VSRYAVLVRYHLSFQFVGLSDLPQTIRNFEPSALVPFPAFEGSRFTKLLDEEMGFI
jgi:beta-1,4-N-acetylglucosaminyltransferase